MNQPGVMIVIEGSDGSGKATQFNLLSERLKATGYDVEVFDFPRYDKDSSHFVKEYLNGHYGSADEISPYTASLFYALDRYEASRDIKKALNQGKIALVNRYVGSNMGHQGAKFEDPVEQRGFFVWEDNLEFQLLNIPRPTINIFLRVPAEISYELIAQKNKRNYTTSIRDQHEADIQHLRKAVSTFDLLCQLFPKDFRSIECTKNGQLLSIAEISNLIWQQILPLLPNDKPHVGHKTVVRLGETKSAPPENQSSSDDKLRHHFKNASLLLKLQIERQIKAVEPSAQFVWSDQDYRYFTPIGLSKDVKSTYQSSLEKIVDLHQKLRQQLQLYYEKQLAHGLAANSLPNISDLLGLATPLAAMCDFSVELSKSEVAKLCSYLLSNDSPELQWAAQQLYLAARQNWPDEFTKPLESADNPVPINNIIAKLSEDRLMFNSGDNNPVKLLEASPRQEFDLLAESIYPYSNLSLDEISEEVSSWSYQQKYETLKQAVVSDSLLEKVKYKFDIISDQLVLNDFNELAYLSNLQVQNPSPRYGYDVPNLLEMAGIDEELFMDCFDESLKLYSLLQQADREDLLIYGALLGHRLRWQFTIDAKNLRLVLDALPGAEATIALAEPIKERLSEIHPLIWDVLANVKATASKPTSSKHNRIKPERRRRSKSKGSPKTKNK
jgi:dTMP kinase